MSDETPCDVVAWPPNVQVIHSRRVGAKCVITYHPDQNGGWLEAGGVLPCGCVAALSSDDDDAAKADWANLPGGGDVDVGQARVYFRHPCEGSSADIRVILPDDAPFRACRKGRVPKRSKSFDDDGNPVHQVRLLYALKTKLRDERRKALEAMPPDAWHGGAWGETWGEVFAAIERLADSAQDFEAYVGGLMVSAATNSKGLSDWALWEKVADDAADFTRRRREIAGGIHAPDNNDRFIQAVKDATAACEGLPAQNHVRQRWEKLGGIGDWREIRRTLGFEWLPTKKERDVFCKAHPQNPWLVLSSEMSSS
jgi:hypothetical protein